MIKRLLAILIGLLALLLPWRLRVLLSEGLGWMAQGVGWVAFKVVGVIVRGLQKGAKNGEPAPSSGGRDADDSGRKP